MTNKHVAEKFALSPSNLHRILTGRRYVGGHETAKTRREDMGEKYVKVAVVLAEAGKGKGKGKSSRLRAQRRVHPKAEQRQVEQRLQ